MDPKRFTSERAGKALKHAKGYYAFYPNPLPPLSPHLKIDSETAVLLSQASQAIGELKGLTSIIADPDLFVYLFVRKEALLSSQIEGTQCSLEDVLDEAPSEEPRHNQKDIKEVSNYIVAMNSALERVKKIPISTRLLKETHSLLLQESRGQEKSPGEFRTSQNWIGSPGATPETAQFIPPPPDVHIEAMSDLEKYIHSNDELPPLIKAGLVHAQFETIHPFLDGNGRLGRLLITLLLCHWGILEKPLIYLSYFFKENRTEYYKKLTNIREKGEWEEWIKFFLLGIVETSNMSRQAAKDIHDLHTSDRLRLLSEPQSVQLVFEAFCKFPIMTIPELVKTIPNSNQNTLNRATRALILLNILKETTKQKRNRKFVYQNYFDTLTRDTQTA